jgi:hypothetical protein
MRIEEMYPGRVPRSPADHRGGYYPGVTPAPGPSEPSSRRLRGPWDTWLVAASLGLLVGARWLREPSPGMAAAFAAVTLVLLVLTWRARALAWRRRVAFATTCLAFAINVGVHQRGIARLEREPDSVRAVLEADATARLAQAVRTAGVELTRIAEAALLVPSREAGSFDALAALVAGPDDRSVIVADSGRPFAWAGRLLVPVDSLPGPVGVVATPFHVVIYAVATKGRQSAIASVLLHAQRPASELSLPLDLRVARAAGVTGFAYGGAGAAASVPRAVVLTIGDEPMLAARALVPPADALAHDARERAVTRGAAMLAVLGLLLLAVAWRRDIGLGGRFAILAVAFGAVAFVPLSSFSNRWPLFDPTFYFVGAGGRFTANAGALAITSGLLLLGLLSALRAGFRPRSRTQALAGVLLVATAGPFVLRDLARGINVPTIGASLGLWLSWQVTLFLAAVTVLLLGVTAGRAALSGTRRGIAAWIAPVIAAVAALSTPIVLEAPGRLPALHPALWILAIAALAFTRRARAIVASVAVVAACGAVTLAWFSTVRDRVQLASEDVHGLSAPDPTSAVLLERYADALEVATAARSRVEVLSRFATSDLAGAELPVEVATWAPDGTPMAELRVGRGSGTAGVNVLADEARSRGGRILREVPGEPGTHVVLAQPHLDGTVTTVVLAPRSALVPPDAFGAFLGFPPPPTPEPPYTLRLGEFAAPGAPRHPAGRAVVARGERAPRRLAAPRGRRDAAAGAWHGGTPELRRARHARRAARPDRSRRPRRDLAADRLGRRRGVALVAHAPSRRAAQLPRPVVGRPLRRVRGAVRPARGVVLPARAGRRSRVARPARPRDAPRRGGVDGLGAARAGGGPLRHAALPVCGRSARRNERSAPRCARAGGPAPAPRRRPDPRGGGPADRRSRRGPRTRCGATRLPRGDRRVRGAVGPRGAGAAR